MNLADELRHTAQQLRDRLDGVPPFYFKPKLNHPFNVPTWRISKGVSLLGHDESYAKKLGLEEGYDRKTAEWIAAFSPFFGEIMASWLDSEAESPEVSSQAVEVARILQDAMMVTESR